MKKFSRGLFYAIIVIGFLLMLYWVEGSSWSSQAVARHNGGYGTFDMKSYDAHVVETVLSSMDSEGFKASYGYYLGDYLFIIFFGLLQCMISKTIYDPLKSKISVTKILFALAMIIPILRGLADLMENTMLVYTLLKYPIINETMVGVATIATSIKLGCIKMWVLLVIIGLILRIVWKCKGTAYKKD